MFTFKRFIDEIVAKKSFVGEGEFFAKRSGDVLELFTFENSNVACFSTFCWQKFNPSWKAEVQKQKERVGKVELEQAKIPELLSTDVRNEACGTLKMPKYFEAGPFRKKKKMKLF